MPRSRASMQLKSIEHQRFFNQIIYLVISAKSTHIELNAIFVRTLVDGSRNKTYISLAVLEK